MKRASLFTLAILLLTSACVRVVSTANPIIGHNPFTPAAVARLCGAADLQTSSNSHNDAEAIILGLTLINQSKSPCSLQGPPQVELLDAGQPLDVQLIQTEPLQTPPISETLTISPGESAVLILIWNNYCGNALNNGPGIHLTLTTGESLNVKPEVSAVPRCETANAPSTLTVNPYSYPP